MPAPKGNNYWELREKHGRKPLFSSPDELWEKCVDYFEWCAENPETVKKMFCPASSPTVVIGEMKVERPMTIFELTACIGINRDTWYELKKKEGFSDIVRHVENILIANKYRGALVGTYSSALIARELSIIDQSNKYPSEDEKTKPIENKGLTEEKANEIKGKILGINE